MGSNKIGMSYKYRIMDIQPQIPENVLGQKGNFCIGVSMNNANYFGNRLRPLIDWLKKRADKTLIVVGDYLHRINEKIFSNSLEVDAIQKGIELGQIFLNNLSDCAISCEKFEIIHWKSILDDPECVEEEKKIRFHFAYNIKFRKEIIHSCKDFIDRQINKGNFPVVKYEDAIMLSSEYILEEMAVFGILAKRGYRVQVYPGTQLPILKALGNGQFPEVDAALKHGIFVDLKIKK